jgi:hypothetical protein
MSEYVTLLGAEDVRAAANTIRSAAQTIQQAASSMEAALDRQRIFLDEWLYRFEEAMKNEKQTKPPSGSEGLG